MPSLLALNWKGKILTSFTRKYVDYFQDSTPFRKLEPYIHIHILCPIPRFEETCTIGCRTPEALSMTIENLLDAFDTDRKGALLREARKLIQPSVIGRLRAIKQELESQYI